MGCETSFYVYADIYRYEQWHPEWMYVHKTHFTNFNIWFVVFLSFYLFQPISPSFRPSSIITRSITHTDPFILCLADRLPALQVKSSSPVSGCMDLPPPSDCPDPSTFHGSCQSETDCRSIRNRLSSGFSRVGRLRLDRQQKGYSAGLRGRVQKIYLTEQQVV